MVRIVAALVLALTLGSSGMVTGQPAREAGPARHAGEVRHSGRIVKIEPDGSGFVLEEMVAWNGPGTGVVTRPIRLTPGTSIRLIERAPEWNGDRTALPGWDATALDPKALRKGDYVTVTTDSDQRDVAVALEVVRPATS